MIFQSLFFNNICWKSHHLEIRSDYKYIIKNKYFELYLYLLSYMISDSIILKFVKIIVSLLLDRYQTTCNYLVLSLKRKIKKCDENPTSINYNI